MNDIPPKESAPKLPPAAKPVGEIPSRGGVGRFFGFLILLLIFIGMGCFAVLVAPGPLSEAKTVVIPHGTNTRGIAASLKENGVIYSSFIFRAASRGIAYGVLKAGEYQFTPGESMADVVIEMHEGRSIVHKFTIAEGLTSAEVVALLKDMPVMTGDITSLPPDGSLLPETYNYSYGDSRGGMIQRMQKDMQTFLNDAWTKRDASIPVSDIHAALTMASIVEKETGKPAERARVAGVFYNRLKQRMRLQSDPTVIYGIAKAKGWMDHNIGHADLSFVSPYNTYLNDGLPPGPICNPGRASVDAALHPETNDYLYFVADGTGGHVFARDLNEHNQNVLHWSQLKAAHP